MKNNTLFLLLSIFANFVAISIQAQKAETKYPIPEIKNVVIQKPKNYSGIIYNFPENISKIIDSVLIENSKYYNFIEMSFTKETVILWIYSIGAVEKNVNKSNRHYYSKDKLVPIVFESDFLYSDFNFAITDGVSLIIEFQKSKWDESYTKIVKIIKE